MSGVVVALGHEFLLELGDLLVEFLVHGVVDFPEECLVVEELLLEIRDVLCLLLFVEIVCEHDPLFFFEGAVLGVGLFQLDAEGAGVGGLEHGLEVFLRLEGNDIAVGVLIEEFEELGIERGDWVREARP